jgi:hypothetical protein
MADTPEIQPLEPWPGYADLDPAERLAQFQRKSDGARERSDQAYAVALSAAVGNYELLRQLVPDLTPDDDSKSEAQSLHDDAGSWKPN